MHRFIAKDVGSDRHWFYRVGETYHRPLGLHHELALLVGHLVGVTRGVVQVLVTLMMLLVVLAVGAVLACRALLLLTLA